MMINNDVFFVVNSKGGVGKSTFVAQALVPLIHKTNGEKEKIRVYEYDDRNNSMSLFQNSNTIQPYLIKSSNKNSGNSNFEKTLQEILFDIDRNYPVIFDIGSENYSSALQDLKANIDLCNKIHFFIPILKNDDDSSNLMRVIKEIKDLKDKVNIIIVFSNAESPFEIKSKDGNRTDLEEEFCFSLGAKFNWQKGVYDPSVFKILNIPEKFLSVKANPSIISEVRQQFAKTVYDMHFENRADMFTKNREYISLNDKGLLTDEQKLEATILNRKYVLVGKCQNYVEKDILPLLRPFQKYLMDANK